VAAIILIYQYRNVGIRSSLDRLNKQFSYR